MKKQPNILIMLADELRGDPARHAPPYPTRYRDARHKLVAHHGNEYRELHDSGRDPDAFDSLWENPAAQPLKNRLLRLGFDASLTITDPGANRIGRP